MNEESANGDNTYPVPKRQPAETEEVHRKRAKYVAAACNQCKRSKSKCIRPSEGDAKCQRCITMKVSCIVVPTASQSAKDKDRDKRKGTLDESHFRQLSNDINSLRDQVRALTETVAQLAERQLQSQPAVGSENRTPIQQHSASPTYTVSATQRSKEPKEPLFVGPTRSAYSFHIAETALTRLGISTNESNTASISSEAPSRPCSPVLSHDEESPYTAIDPMVDISESDAVRLVGIYEDEIACVHPIVETRDLVASIPATLESLRKADYNCNKLSPSNRRDVLMLKLAIATAIICETHGKNEISDSLAASVEQDSGNISGHGELDLKEVQISAMMSLYFCHASEELFAWRAIGRAARQCLEMGLHRKQSLIDNFREENSRKLAVQVFWVVYELDRRWSFGTSLSFALNDRDIDPQLPEPGKNYPYLKCMVAYARLCSRVWEALPPYGSPLQIMPKETEEYLEFVTQSWLLSIPSELQFKHPDLGLAPEEEPRQLRRLRTMLYLRGNFMRTLISRHHVLNADNIRSDILGAQQVVDFAKDTIQVLVHLNNTSDIYAREQSIYHYYLLGALAVVLLAVCHAPNMFAETCRESFVSAVELVKGFSSHSTASHRLWRSVRGLLPIVKSLSLRAEVGRREQEYKEHSIHTQALHTKGPSLDSDSVMLLDHDSSHIWAGEHSTFGGTVDDLPNVSHIGNDLMDLYEVFGSAVINEQDQSRATSDDLGEQGPSTWNEVSRHFHELL